MLNFCIEGGKKLEGEVHISGSKNAALPIIAATVLNGGISKLYNVPKIHDTEMMYKILENLGCTVKKAKNKVRNNYNWNKIAQDTYFTYQKAVCQSVAEKQKREIEQERVRKARKTRGEGELSNLLPFRKRGSYA